MRKMISVFAMVMALSASYVVARTTGVLYGEALSIESIRGTVVASISNAGALVVSSIVNSGAISATNADFSGTLDADGQFTWGAAGTKSTGTVAGNLTIPGALSAATGVTVSAGPLTVYSRTEAQLLALTPTAVGQVYYCSDCSVSKGLVVSTGTTEGGQFAAADGSKFD